jgi:subtilisin family serine protease
VNVYVIDAGVDRAHPDLNVVDHVNFTWSANTATCAHGTRVSGVLAARDNGFGASACCPVRRSPRGGVVPSHHLLGHRGRLKAWTG